MSTLTWVRKRPYPGVYIAINNGEYVNEVLRCSWIVGYQVGNNYYLTAFGAIAAVNRAWRERQAAKNV